MRIDGTRIGLSPYIVAEISCNHCGDIERAFELINVAKDSGADAVKFQAYTADTITLDSDKPDFIIKDGPWKGRRLYELYTVAQTPWEWWPHLFKTAHDLDITIFASVFDYSSVSMLEGLDCPAYKIASMEIVDIPLIKHAASTGKPLIISTGMASEEEIYEAVYAVTNIPANYCVLSCVSGYPTPIEEANLERFLDLHSNLPYVGISDHTLGWEIPVAATALGAAIIEKHLCLSRSDPTEDAAFSLEPHEFKKMCDTIRAIWQALQPSEAKSEESSRQLRRSLYVTEDMKKGEMFTEANVRSIRPGYGMAPKFLPKILGCFATQEIARGTALREEMISGV